MTFSLEQSLPFEIVQVDATGTIIKRENLSAPLLVEDLGNGVQLEMMMIPGGKFWMGQTETEKEELIRQVGEEDYQKLYTRELPRHQVTLNPFLMGRYTVTQAQWKQIAALEKVEINLTTDFNFRFPDNSNPAERVTWNEAVEFCIRLSKATGRDYRLPTEAEWEYACRARTVTPFYFGETITTDLVNYDGNYAYGQGPEGKYLEKTTPVGNYVPNGWGLHEMHGNVWEWCSDDWHDNYKEKPDELKQNGNTSWISTPRNTRAYSKPFRGGSWYNTPRNCRSAFRNDDMPDIQNSRIGFRVVCFPAKSLP
jgi:formylglycine-generating enzyme required for sulfatase activity